MIEFTLHTEKPEITAKQPHKIGNAQKFLTEFDAPYKVGHGENAEIHYKHVGIRPHAQRKKFPDLFVICICSDSGHWSKEYFYDRKNDVLRRYYDKAYIEPESMTTAHILEKTRSFFMIEDLKETLATINSQPASCSAPEHNDNVRADDSADNNVNSQEVTQNAQQEDSQPDAAPASQPAVVVSTECETTAQSNVGWDISYGSRRKVNDVPAHPECVNFIVGKSYFCPNNIYIGETIFTVLSRSKRIYRDGEVSEFIRVTFDQPKKFYWDFELEFCTFKIEISDGVETACVAEMGVCSPFINANDVVPTPIAQPENLYYDEPYSDYPGDNSCPEQDIPADHVPDAVTAVNAMTANDTFIPGNVYFCAKDELFTVIKRLEKFITLADNNGKIFRRKIYASGDCEAVRIKKFPVGSLFLSARYVKKENKPADNPGFTIVPSEHITRPNYAAYPDTIQDECPYVTVHACNFQKHNTAAAVVPYDQAASIRKFFHIIALYFRLWLAMNISRRDIAISMPVIIPATVNDITPQQPTKKECATASAHDDIEHKLFDTKDLPFAEKRKALDHNAAVITSCMFPEAVISLLMSISAKAILQLGFHMRLFIAKPKGTKKVIAELFANRLIDSRNLHANVRTKPGNITAKSPANIPDGVKFFVGAKRQICFKFDDPQLDLPLDD